ncbi:MAG: hypothetical protein V1702_05275 [Candidatus Woesearchaeota archaeon]
MSINKLVAAALIFLAAVMPASAIIAQLGSINPEYNLGQKVLTGFTASSEQAFEGIFRATLECGSYSLDYYTTPIMFEESADIPVPALTLSKYALGECKIKAALLTADNSIMDSFETPRFQVRDTFPIIITANTTTIKPNDEVKVSIAFGSYIPDNAEVMFRLNGESWQGSLDRTIIKASKSIRPGSFPLAVEMTDSAGNTAENFTQMEVLSVPSSLLVHTDITTLKPKDVMHFFAEILDQANNSISGQVSFVITGGKEKILEKNTATGEAIAFMPGPYMKPGDYKLLAKSLQFSETIFLTVVEWREVDIAFDNRTANFTNSGNVDYEDTLTINAVKEGTSYLLEKKVSLKPGESYSVDLFKELPKGTYDIMVGEKEYKAVEIQDERSGFKRVYQGLGAITGAAVGLPGAMSMKMATVLMAVIAAIAIIAFYIQLRKKRARKQII